MPNKISISKLLVTTVVLSQFIAQSISFAAPPRPQPPRPGPGQPSTPPQPAQEIDRQLADIISGHNLSPINSTDFEIPDINSEKSQLGKKLFFSKNLGGQQSAACVSCHHPTLGGADDLSLSVGVNAVDELNQSAHDLLGQGRFNGSDNLNLPVVPRNAPTVFNLALNNRALFWDGRIERARRGGIFTPDSAINDEGRRQPDASLPANTNLAAAQARFPATSAEEMRGNHLPDASNSEFRQDLALRFDNSQSDYQTNWPQEFATVYPDLEITFDLIADAIAEYENSMFFVNSPWNQYLEGNSSALTDEQKAGAVLFFTPPQQGGAGCVNCHNGPTMTNNRHHLTAFPQIGPGKGNQSTTTTSQDFGRENITGNSNDKFHFKTPSLLNVSTSAPYGHTGSYQTLEQVIQHYNNPFGAITNLFGAVDGVPFNQTNAQICQLSQVADITDKNNISCSEIFPNGYANSLEVLTYLQQALDNEVDARAPLRIRPRLSDVEVSQLAEFLRALTDPCIEDRACLAPWIIDEADRSSFPDAMPLIAHDSNNNLL